RHDRLRPVAPEALHVTLAFLGAREEDDVPVIAAALERLARPVGALSFGEVLWLPRRRPRGLAVGVVEGGGAVAALQADVAAALEEGIGFEPERRAFLAHVTVCRMRTPGKLPEPGPLPQIAPFSATSLTLFASHLSPRGANYERLSHASLHSP